MKTLGNKTVVLNSKSMSVNLFSLKQGGAKLLLALFIFLSLPLFAAPRRYGNEDDTAIREIRDSLDSLKHEVDNHETEIHMFEERMVNQESTISSMRQQLLDANQSNKDLLKGNAASWESRIVNVETANKGLAADMRQFKSHANETTEALGLYKQRISDLEKLINVQNQNLENLQAALRSLTEALQVKEGPIASSEGGKSYRVKPGDSLEKIAKANGTTIKALKELNNLSNDRINVGQTLQLP